MSENSSTETTTNGLCEVCQQPSELKCSACKLVNYCCLEHQKDHWKTHKDICKPFEVAENKDVGRYLLATRDLNVGDLIFSEAPFVFAPKPHLLNCAPFPCVGCCRLIDEKTCKQCPECSWPACSPECEGLKIPSVHGFECRVLKLYLQKNQPQKWEELMKLQDHFGKRCPGTETFKIVQEKVEHLEKNYLNPLKEYELESGQVIIPEVSSALIHKIYGILDVNATELSEEIDAEILYPTASLIEHNCTPNTYQTIDPKNKCKITFRAALPIKKNDHITSIYTHILWGTQARREHLLNTKYFECSCNRCKDPTELGTFLSALHCLGTEEEPCGGTQLPENPLDASTKWVCNKCAISLPNEDIMKFVNHLSGEVDKVMVKHPSMEELEDVLGKLLNFLHPNHYLVYSVKHSLVQLYTGRGDVEVSHQMLLEKLKMIEELLDVTRRIDPGNARLSLYLGVLLNEQYLVKSKILYRSYDEDKKEAIKSEVKEILKLLELGMSVLGNDLLSSEGEKLHAVVCENQKKFMEWLKENQIEVV